MFLDCIIIFILQLSSNSESCIIYFILFLLLLHFVTAIYIYVNKIQFLYISVPIPGCQSLFVKLGFALIHTYLSLCLSPSLFLKTHVRALEAKQQCNLSLLLLFV